LSVAIDYSARYSCATLSAALRTMMALMAITTVGFTQQCRKKRHKNEQKYQRVRELFTPDDPGAF